MRFVASVFLSIAAAACGGGGVGSQPYVGLDAGTGEVEIGQGELAFAPLADGETLPYVAGAQGGHHVYVSFRMHGLDPERVQIEVTTSVEGFPDLTLTRRGRQNFDLEADDAGAGRSYVYAGWPAQIASAPLHVGVRAGVAVRLIDLDGRTARDEKTVVIGDAAP